MAGKDTRVASQRPFPRKRWIVTLGSLAVLVACVAFRYWRGPELAGAGAPPRRSATTSRPTSGPARQPARPANARRAGATKPAPRVSKNVAAVNKTEITRQYLAQETVLRFGAEVLETMINKRLILDACKKYNIVVSDDDVNAEVERTANKWGMSSEHYLKMLLKERNIDPQKYRQDIVWPSLALRRLANEELVISQEELNKAWESQYGERVQTRMISISTQSKAEAVLKQAQANPEGFGKLAKDVSEDPNSASTRGLIPPIQRHRGELAIEKAVFALQPGQISPVVHAAGQYLIFRCEKRLPPTKVAAQYKQKAITQLRDRLRDDKLRDKAEEIFATLQSQSHIVNVYNDDKLRKQMPGIVAVVNKHRITQRELGEESISRFGVEVLQREIDRQLLKDAIKARRLTVTSDDQMKELARAAEMFGVLKNDGSPDVERWLKEKTAEEKVSVKVYIYDSVWPSAALRKLVASQVKVTADDLKKAYEANYGEQVNVQAIVVGSQRRATEVWQLAVEKSDDAEFFGHLAYEYSIEPVSRENFGQIPPIRLHSGEPLVEKEAFRLVPGEVSGVVAVGKQFVILRCIGRSKEADVPQFAEVKGELHADILDKKVVIAMNNEFNNIRKSAYIANKLTGLNQVPEKKKIATTVPRRATPKSSVKPATFERKTAQ